MQLAILIHLIQSRQCAVNLAQLCSITKAEIGWPLLKWIDELLYD